MAFLEEHDGFVVGGDGSNCDSRDGTGEKGRNKADCQRKRPAQKWDREYLSRMGMGTDLPTAPAPSEPFTCP